MIEIDLDGTGMLFVEVKTNAVIVLGYGYLGGFFNNCTHINEPGCAIKEAVINGEIDEDRYVSYYNILESINEQKWRDER